MYIFTNTNHGRSPRTLGSFVRQTSTTCSAYRGSSETSPTRRRSRWLSDWQGLFDGSKDQMSMSRTIRSFLRLRDVLIPPGSCILGRGTGRTTRGGRWCGSTVLRGVNPRSLHAYFLSPAQNAKKLALIPTSDIFSLSISIFSLMVVALRCCSRPTQNTHLHIHNGSQMRCCVILGQLGPK